MSHVYGDRWKRPQLYGTIVALCLFAMSAFAAISLGWSIALAPNAVASLFFIILLAPSVPAAVMLMCNRPGWMTKGVAQVALVFWTLLEVIFFWGFLVNFGHPAQNPPPLWGYLIGIALLSASGVMWVLLHKRFPHESGRLFNLSQ